MTSVLPDEARFFSLRLHFIYHESTKSMSIASSDHYRTNRYYSNRRFDFYCVLILEVEGIFFEDDFSGDRFRRDTWKTSQVLKCIRELRSIIIHPSKKDVSSEFMDCLKGKKVAKLDKKKPKT